TPSRPPRDLHSFPTRRSSDLNLRSRRHVTAKIGFSMSVEKKLGKARGASHDSRRVGRRRFLKQAAAAAMAAGSTFAAAAQEKARSEEHTSELQSRGHLVCRLL